MSSLRGWTVFFLQTERERVLHADAHDSACKVDISKLSTSIPKRLETRTMPRDGDTRIVQDHVVQPHLAAVFKVP